MDDLNHLTDEARDFLFHMQQRHGLTTPLFRTDMSTEQLQLARHLVEERLLVEDHIEESDAEDTTYYVASRPSWFYYGQLAALMDFV